MDFNAIADQSRASIEHEDLKVLLPIVASINPKRIFEIGTHRGYSAETWIAAFNPSEFVTFEIDKKPDDAVELAYKEAGENSYHYLWETDSHNNTLVFDKGAYDFMFIDGDHSLDGVTLDWDMYSDVVRKGGIVAFHDVLHYNKDPEVNVKPLWEQLKGIYPFVEIKVGKNSTGIGVLFV